MLKETAEEESIPKWIQSNPTLGHDFRNGFFSINNGRKDWDCLGEVVEFEMFDPFSCAVGGKIVFAVRLLLCE